jgi:hypothetical protein
MTNLNKLLSKACEANGEKEIFQSRAALESAIWKPAPSPGIAGAFNKAAISIIPEFINAACNKKLANREWFVDLLLRMAVGDPTKIDFYGFDYKKYGQNLSPGMNEAYESIEKELTKLSTLLGDPSVEVRSSIAYLLSFFSRKSKVNAKKIAKQLEVELDHSVKASLQFALATLESYQNSFDHWHILETNLQRVTGENPGQDILIVSILHKYGKTDDYKLSVMQTLINALTSAQPIPPLQNFKWSNGDLLNLILMEVMAINMEDADDQFMIDNLIPIIARIEEGTAWGELAATKALYRVFTPCTRKPTPDKWDNWQQVDEPLKRFVSACLNHPKHLTPIILNALGDHGFPSDLANLKKFAN